MYSEEIFTLNFSSSVIMTHSQTERQKIYCQIFILKLSVNDGEPCVVSGGLVLPRTEAE